MPDEPVLDALDLALLTALRDKPRAGVLELSRTVGVARATVQSRLDRMERAGVLTGCCPPSSRHGPCRSWPPDRASR